LPTGVIPIDAPRFGNGEARISAVRLTDAAGVETTQLQFGQRFRVSFDCEVFTSCPDMHFEVSISSQEGDHITCSTTIDRAGEPVALMPGWYAVDAELDLTLLPRAYTIDLGVHHQNGTTSDFVQRTLDFVVLRIAEEGHDDYRWGTTRGYIRAPSEWRITDVKSAQKTISIDCRSSNESGIAKRVDGPSWFVMPNTNGRGAR
jgi:hypothetical protein